MRKLLLFCALIGGMIHGRAQETLTLEDCLRLGIENNLKLQTSRNEVLKARHNISENRAKLLPQINAVASFNDNFNPPVSVTDGSASVSYTHLRAHET